MPDSDTSTQNQVWRMLRQAGQALEQYNLDNVNVNLLRIIARPPRRVLDVGCYGGGNGAAVKQQFPAAQVVGIEPNWRAASVAQTRLDQVHCCTLEDLDFEIAGIEKKNLDLVILSDVLEHMYDPWTALCRLHPYLAGDGQILAAIPNIRHLGVLEKLLAGDWDYERTGVLDVTHVRFFSRRSIERMFSDTGYKIQQMVANIDPAYAALLEIKNQDSAEISRSKFSIKAVNAGEATELAAYQFLVQASPVSR